MNKALYIFFIIAIIPLFYGFWILERKINYQFSYQSMVQEQLKPLVIQINALNNRVKALEEKNK